jgi:hypothetical protein
LNRGRESVHSDHRSDLLYFVENPRDRLIWIGHNSANAPDRPKQHRSYGFTDVLAYMPGSTSDEDDLHDYFHQYAVDGGNSRYEACDSIFNYVSWLLDRGFAVQDRDEAHRLAAVPWAARSPRAWEDPDHATNGQLTFLAALPARERVRYVAAGVLATKASESDEWFSPEVIVELAREAMGSIDTDPASHPDANARFVRAAIWYGKEQNGLRTDLPWQGNVFMNPPYGRGEGAASAFVRRLVQELELGNVTQAVTCLNSDSMTSLWFDPVWAHAAVHLIMRGRPNFWRPGNTGDSPTKGTVLSYFGAREDAFIRAARAYGNLVRRTGPPHEPACNGTVPTSREVA